MKKNLKFLFLAIISVTVVAGCAGTMKTEEISEGTKPEASQSQGDTQVVPDDKPATEQIKTEDLTGASGKESSAKYASIIPGDELTKLAQDGGKLFTIYFDYDNYSIRDQDKNNLAKNAKWLGLNPVVKVFIEGHADERGETEYNLALGDKRASSVRRYLNDLGIEASRMTVISYGEEKPATNGHDEEAWAMNRRAEFMLAN